MHITEMLKQELRFRKQFSLNIVKYKTTQGEFIWNRESKTVYYKANNRKYPEYLGTIAL